MSNEGWVSLNGCNTCINTNFCKPLGNCAILSLDAKYPNNKRKRRLIQRIRTMEGGSVEYFVSQLTYKNFEEADTQNITLTKLEKMFIEELNKPR